MSVRRGEKNQTWENKNRQNTHHSLHSIPLKKPAVAINSAQKGRKTIQLGYFRNSLRTVMDDEPLYWRVVCLVAREERRRCVCVCARARASNVDRRKEEESWNIRRGIQPGAGAQRVELRQHPSADSRPAACGPTREGRTRLTHCTRSNSFTAKPVWVGGLLL